MTHAQTLRAAENPLEFKAENYMQKWMLLMLFVVGPELYCPTIQLKAFCMGVGRLLQTKHKYIDLRRLKCSSVCS